MASAYGTDIFLKRLYYIHEQCAAARQSKEDADAEANLDAFTRLRKSIAADVRLTREMIHERNKSNITEGGDALAAKQSNDIRLQIKDIQLDIQRLDKMQKKKQKKLSKQHEPDDELIDICSGEKEVVCFALQHVRELEKMERFGDDIEQAGLFGQEEEPIVYGALPDIDDPQFKALIEGDKMLDQGLEDILAALQTVKTIAEEMSGELQAQEELVDKVHIEMGAVEERLETVNSSLKSVLKRVRGPKQFFCDMLLCCIILGVAAAVIYILVK